MVSLPKIIFVGFLNSKLFILLFLIVVFL